MLNDVYRTDIEFFSFMPFPEQVRLVAALPHAGIAVDWLGDGMRYAVNILALGVLLKGTALLVEELETHQHPESLRKLTQTLFELAKQQDLQLFLTTHSLELIDYAMEAAEEKAVELKLFHLSLDQEGQLKATPFPQPDAKLLLDIGHDPRLHYKYIGAK
jgi:AAA15 family ATPase/GTPase